MDALTAHQAAQPGFLRKTIAEALEVAELAWNAKGATPLTGLAFNVKFKLRAALELLGADDLVLAPSKPTLEMRVAGFESEAWDRLSSAVLKKGGWPYSCRQSAQCVSAIYSAMLDARPALPGASPASEGGGEPVSAAQSPVDVLMSLMDGEAVEVAAISRARAWVEEQVQASGLTAEGNEAVATTRPLRAGAADSSGLAAESNEAAATSAMANGERADAPVPEPVDWHFDRMLQQLGGKPA